MEPSWTTSPALEAYQKWAKENGCTFPKLQIVNFVNFWGCGGLVEEPLEQGETVVAVPFKLLINHQNILKTDPFSKIASDLQEFDPLWVIYIFLIHERANPDSFWRQFIDVLPTHYSTPLWWDEECIKELLGSNLHDTVVQVQASLERIYNDIVPKLNAKHPSIFKKEVFTWYAFLWAYSTFWTRCFAVNKGGEVVPSMAPVCDAMNHSEKAKVTFSFNAETNMFQYQVTESGQGKGQFFVDYKTNCKTSEAQLLYYGFISDDMILEQDSCWVQLGLKNGDEALDVKMKLLAANNIPQRHYLKANHLPTSLIQAMRICLLDESEVYFFGSSCNGQKMISIYNEVQVLQTLKKMITDKKNKFTSTLEQDKQKYESVTGKQPINGYKLDENKLTTEKQFHLSLALWYRIAQREILERSIHLVNQQLDKLLPVPACCNPPFFDWPPLPEKGATKKVCNLQLASHQGNSIPVAKVDLQPDSLLLAFSSKQLITPQWVAKTKIGKAVAWAQQRKKLARKEIDWEDMAMTLYLIYEKYNPQSNWISFFKALPSHFHNTLCWNDSELGELEETELLDQTLQLKAQLQGDFSVVIQVLAEKFPDLFPQDKFTFANYLWAFTLFETRRFMTEEGPVLLPLPYTLSHHPLITVQKQVDVATTILELKTVQTLPANSVVYDSFGRLPNQQLMLIHGICVQDNPYETLEIDFDIRDNDPLQNKKADLLQKRNIKLSNKLGMTQLSPFMLHALRICLATSPSELETLDVDLLTTHFKALIPDQEKTMLTTLDTTLQSLVSEEELIADDAQPHEILAIQFRSAQNVLLRRNIEFISQALKEI